jgi:prefoldin subunit 5
LELVEVETNMKYRVKVKGGVSVFHDKELAEKCAKKNKTKVEEIKTDDEQMQSFAEDLRATDSGHRPS